MRAIWKFPLSILPTTEVDMPAGAKILRLGTQDNEPVLWALVDADPAVPKEPRRFAHVPTGQGIVDEAGVMEYVGTYQIDLGPDEFVGHVFEVPR